MDRLDGAFEPSNWNETKKTLYKDEEIANELASLVTERIVSIEGQPFAFQFRVLGAALYGRENLIVENEDKLLLNGVDSGEGYLIQHLRGSASQLSVRRRIVQCLEIYAQCALVSEKCQHVVFHGLLSHGIQRQSSAADVDSFSIDPMNYEFAKMIHSALNAIGALLNRGYRFDSSFLPSLLGALKVFSGFGLPGYSASLPHVLKPQHNPNFIPQIPKQAPNSIKKPRKSKPSKRTRAAAVNIPFTLDSSHAAAAGGGGGGGGGGPDSSSSASDSNNLSSSSSYDSIVRGGGGGKISASSTSVLSIQKLQENIRKFSFNILNLLALKTYSDSSSSELRMYWLDIFPDPVQSRFMSSPDGCFPSLPTLLLREPVPGNRLLICKVTSNWINQTKDVIASASSKGGASHAYAFTPFATLIAGSVTNVYANVRFAIQSESSISALTQLLKTLNSLLAYMPFSKLQFADEQETQQSVFHLVKSIMCDANVQNTCLTCLTTMVMRPDEFRPTGSASHPVSCVTTIDVEWCWNRCRQLLTHGMTTSTLPSTKLIISATSTGSAAGRSAAAPLPVALQAYQLITNILTHYVVESASAATVGGSNFFSCNNNWWSETLDQVKFSCAQEITDVEFHSLRFLRAGLLKLSSQLSSNSALNKQSNLSTSMLKSMADAWYQSITHTSLNRLADYSTSPGGSTTTASWSLTLEIIYTLQAFPLTLLDALMTAGGGGHSTAVGIPATTTHSLRSFINGALDKLMTVVIPDHNVCSNAAIPCLLHFVQQTACVKNAVRILEFLRDDMLRCSTRTGDEEEGRRQDERKSTVIKDNRRRFCDRIVMELSQHMDKMHNDCLEWWLKPENVSAVIDLCCTALYTTSSRETKFDPSGNLNSKPSNHQQPSSSSSSSKARPFNHQNRSSSMSSKLPSSPDYYYLKLLIWTLSSSPRKVSTPLIMLSDHYHTRLANCLECQLSSAENGQTVRQCLQLFSLLLSSTSSSSAPNDTRHASEVCNEETKVTAEVKIAVQRFIEQLSESPNNIRRLCCLPTPDLSMLFHSLSSIRMQYHQKGTGKRRELDHDVVVVVPVIRLLIRMLAAIQRDPNVLYNSSTLENQNKIISHFLQWLSVVDVKHLLELRNDLCDEAMVILPDLMQTYVRDSCLQVSGLFANEQSSPTGVAEYFAAGAHMDELLGVGGEGKNPGREVIELMITLLQQALM